MKGKSFLLSALLVFVPVSARAQGTVTFGGGASAQTPPPAAPPAPPPERTLLAETVGRDQGPESAEDKEWADRDRKMNEASTLTGGVGLLHMQYAQGGAPGQFRLGFTTEYFSAGFLCSSSFPCPATTAGGVRPVTDSTDHIGGRLTLSMQLTKWLESYLATSALANSNDRNRPSLLQVLGDSVIGAKAHGALSGVFHLGGAFELWLVNGTGSVGLDGAGTSAKFRALASTDFRGAQKPIPLRFGLAMTYVVDNSGEVIARTEANRGTSVTRIERFGLNVNRVDHFDIGFGGEIFAAQEKVRPFAEINVAIPVNRQDYRCRQNNPSADKCLATTAIAPASLTIGSRFFPWKRGFNLLLAVDIGLEGVNTFIEEVRPTPPWMLYMGAGWAFDTQDRPPIVKERVVEKPVAARRGGRKVHGFVHEEGQTAGIPNAIVSWENHPELTSLVTNPDGSFTTHELDEGPYMFGIRADGYKPGQCTTTIVRAAGQGGRVTAPKLAPAQPNQANPAGQPAPPPAQPPPPPPTGGGDVQLDCVLQALPRVGNIVGHVKDMESGASIASASVRVLDAQKKELTGTTDPDGKFRFELVSPGESEITIDAPGYLAFVEKLDVKPRQDNPAELALKKKPKDSLVQLGKQEIVIKQQIQFAVDSAVILPESTGLLTEIADVFIKNPRVRRVEVQGHTDNTGTPDHNMKLSEDRANAVVSWLTSHGVGADRLVAKGFGQSKPIAPNVTAATRARNRRVQFIILDQDEPVKGGGPPGGRVPF